MFVQEELELIEGLKEWMVLATELPWASTSCLVVWMSVTAPDKATAAALKGLRFSVTVLY